MDIESCYTLEQVKAPARRYALTGLFFLALAHSALAQLSPGDLALPHTSLEGLTNCTKCHTLGGGPAPENCLACHLEIKQSVLGKRGFHFLVTTREAKDCFECHSEHNGKSFDLIHWPNGKEKFNHTRTGFDLVGKHAEVKCETCHQPKNIAHDPRTLNKEVDLERTFLGLGQKCLSCHEDEHQGQLPQDCLRCHTMSGWKPPAKFDHKQAKFKLTGKHVEVACAKCHPPVIRRSFGSAPVDKLTFVKYVGILFQNCNACHADAHDDRFGQNCKKCHLTTSWRQINSGTFDHSKTRFPLLGLHQQVTCNKCHTSGNLKAQLQFANCSDCHRDTHFGQFADRADGGRCESCHDVSGFSPANFDVQEHTRTRYPLTGAHLAVPCVACHFIEIRGKGRDRRLFEFPDTSCQTCHQDIHQGQFVLKIQLGGCESCHQTETWLNTTFDHDASRFPLLGKHTEVSCRQCHKVVDSGTSRERILFTPMETRCGVCHEDAHFGQFSRGQFKKTCDRCHDPAGWQFLLFDHDRDALFRLRGAHERVPCLRCHKRERTDAGQFVRFRPIDRRCIHCHGEKGKER